MKKGDEMSKNITIKPFKNIYEFKKVLVSCHDVIRTIEGYDPVAAFDEMSKILFLKMFDERKVEMDNYQHKIQFAVYADDRKEDTVERIRGVYEMSQNFHQEIFKEAEREYPTLLSINLKDSTIYQVVKKLQNYSLLKTEVEIKGLTYEFFLKSSFRGILGQFFTPYEVVEFMINLIEPKRTDLVLDPACGSGGFLVETMKTVYSKIDDLHKKGIIKDPIREKQIFTDNYLYGLDLNARMSWVAKMNMVMHGNGHGHIHHHDALIDSEIVRSWGITPGKFDVILTNPPFGSNVVDQNILSNYNLSVGRKRQITEVLFLDRCLGLLKEGGILGIVVPDGLLSNTSVEYVRKYLDENAIWKAIISLPQETFAPYGSVVKASLLFLQKKDKEGKLKQNKIFMAIAENIGYDSTGRSTNRNDLKEIVKAYKRNDKI